MRHHLVHGLGASDRAALQSLITLAGTLGAGTIFALFLAGRRRPEFVVFEVFAIVAVLASLATTAYFAVALLHRNEAISDRELAETATPLVPGAEGATATALTGWFAKGRFHLDAAAAARLARLVDDGWGAVEAGEAGVPAGGPLLREVEAPRRGRDDLAAVTFDPAGGKEWHLRFERDEQGLFDITELVRPD